MKNAKMNVLSTVSAVISGLVLSASMILLPVQGAVAADAAKATAKAPAKKATVKKAVKKHAPSAFWKKVQTALIAKGAKIKADGFAGSATHKAILAFQKANKLKATGKINAATKKALGLK
ncbi:MAG: peptidoglycan-binding domain-containing protein [Leptospirales bacterium]